MIQLLFLSVKNEYCEVEVSRKGYPQKIRHLQSGGNRGDFSVMQNCEKNRHPEEQKPDERKQKILHIKEYDAPEEVEKQAD